MITILPVDKLEFPPLTQALCEPNGLLAIGGDLRPERLLLAYRHGIFPWFNEGEPIMWWSPDPRLVLLPNKFKQQRSLRQLQRKQQFRYTVDHAFSAVIEACSAPRPHQDGSTWLNPMMQQAYTNLHQLGYAHSIEVWHEQMLVGGLYGIRLGQVFFGESMFSRMANTSKLALVHLLSWLQAFDCQLIDCQVPSQHLIRLGAELIPRATFIQLLATLC